MTITNIAEFEEDIAMDGMIKGRPGDVNIKVDNQKLDYYLNFFSAKSLEELIAHYESMEYGEYGYIVLRTAIRKHLDDRIEGSAEAVVAKTELAQLEEG